MRKILSRLRIGVVPLILCLALFLTGIMSVHSIVNLQGNARVINYTRIIRGATQRSIKKALNHVPDDDLIKRVDDILDGLSNGSDDLDFIKIEGNDFQAVVSTFMEDHFLERLEAMIARCGISKEYLDIEIIESQDSGYPLMILVQRALIWHFWQPHNLIS